MTNHPPQAYAIGDVVRRRADPSSVGQVKGCTWSDQLEDWLYQVRFGLRTVGVSGDELEPLPEEADLWDDLRHGRFGDPETLQRLLVVHRLRKPSSRIAAAFGTARARVLPYQFKPLLKFLENQSQRLLIADDVGLGKTVEAGYVLREMRARANLERVVVVVPARLREKWRNELDRRFDERFTVVNRTNVQKGLLEPIAAGRELPELQWIVSYESLRAAGIINAFRELRPAIDLLIVDEAHKARNPETLQSRVVRVLAECATAALFLTATPIQTSLENLYNLLWILEPDAFPRFDVFRAQLERTRPVGRALAALRQSPPDAESARRELEQLLDGNSGPARQFISSLMQRLADVDGLDRSELVAVQRDISEMSPIAHLVSRTRKVEVMPDRPVRHALSITVRMTDAERQYYDAVVDMCEQANDGGWGASMWGLTAFRCAASCIPASVEYFRHRASQPASSLDFGSDLEEEDAWLPDGDTSAEPATRDLVSGLLERLLRTPRAFPVDSKFTEFRKALREVWREDHDAGRPRRKVLVFAFFKRTLHYLSERLGAAGVSHVLIHGDMPIPEREAAIEQFLTQPDLLVLLSSEVGSEGLDLQDASVVVNYDLPWNPMVVEQRIGRIDRIGQRSPTLTIVNLTLADTIEEHILMRLYERIGLFRETVGELEDILGERVRDLVAEALKGHLTPQEQRRQADLTADAIIGEQLQARRLQSEAETLIAGDQAFLDEVEALIGERKVPTAAELHRFIGGFVRDRYPGSRVPVEMVADVAPLSLRREIVSDLNAHLPPDADVRRLISRVQEGALNATFDPDVFLRHPRAELLTARHPLIRLACALVPRDTEGGVRTFHAAVRRKDGLASGTYVVLLWQVAIGGLRPRVDLRPVVWSVTERRVLESEESATLYRLVLDDAREPKQTAVLSDIDVRTARAALEREVDRLRRHLRDTEAGLAVARAERRRQTLEGTLLKGVEAAERRLRQLLEKPDVHPFPLRMAERHLQKERARLEDFRTSMDVARTVNIEEEDVGLVLVLVS